MFQYLVYHLTGARVTTKNWISRKIFLLQITLIGVVLQHFY